MLRWPLAQLNAFESFLFSYVSPKKLIDSSGWTLVSKVSGRVSRHTTVGKQSQATPLSGEASSPTTDRQLRLRVAHRLHRLGQCFSFLESLVGGW